MDEAQVKIAVEQIELASRGWVVGLEREEADRIRRIVAMVGSVELVEVRRGTEGAFFELRGREYLKGVVRW